MTVRLLGPPEIRRAGTRVEVDTRKAVALLAYLVISGPAVTRDHLAALLWPDHDHSRARAALRRTLSTLRRAVGDQHIEATRQQIELVLSGLDVDVIRFKDLAAADDPASLGEAWELYRGDLLLGFGLRDSPGFDDWHRRETERLRTVAGDVLDRLALLSEQSGSVAAAVQHAEARLSLDPLSEPAHRRLMELEARRGERGAAIARYRTLVRTLSEELGVSPLDETTAVYEAIRRGETTTPHVRPVSTGSVESGLSLCGRDSELSAVLTAIPRDRRHGHLVVVAGSAGMGTTRFAGEVADRLRRTGAVVASARCHAHESDLGYASIVALIRGLLDGRTVDDLDLPRNSTELVAGLIPELGDAETPPAGVFRLYEALAEVILALAGGSGPPILVLDDVHRIDAAGRGFLTFLVNRLDSIPIAIVATVHPDEADHSDPLLALVGELQEGERTTLVPIGTLTEDQTAALALAAGCDDIDAAELHHTTGGVPFFIAEYLRSGCQEALAGAIPDSVGRTVTNRLARLEPLTRQIFAAGALLAEPADTELLRRVAGRTIDEVAEAVDDLVRAGLLIGDGQGSYAVANTVTAQVAYEQIGAERRRLLHHRAAVALEERPGHTATAARHYQRSGDTGAAAQAYLAAGDHAKRTFANQAAKSCYQAALDLGHPDTDLLRESIADLATAAGLYAEARHHYELVAATSTGADLARIEEKLGLLHLRLGKPEIAVSHFQSALAEAGDDTDTTARLLAHTAAAQNASGALTDATATIDAACLTAERAGSGAVLAAVENVRGSIAGRWGDEADAREAFERSLHLAEVDGDAALSIAAANNLALTLNRADERSRARELLKSALEQAMRVGEEHRAAALHSNLADILHEEGETAAAADHIRQMAQLMAEINAQFDEPNPEIWLQTTW